MRRAGYSRVKPESSMQGPRGRTDMRALSFLRSRLRGQVSQSKKKADWNCLKNTVMHSKVTLNTQDKWDKSLFPGKQSSPGE